METKFSTKKTKNGIMPEIMSIHDLMKIDFMKSHFHEIEQFSFEHFDELGFTLIFVNKDLTIDSIEFVKGRFNRNQFIRITVDYPLNPFDDVVEEVRNEYHMIIFRDKTTLMFYRNTIQMISSHSESEFRKYQPYFKNRFEKINSLRHRFYNRDDDK